MSDEEFEQLMVKLADNSALVSLTLNLSQQNSAQVQRKLNKLSDYFRKYDHKNISYLVIHEGLEHRLFSGFSDSFQENREAALQLWNKIADGALSSLRTEDFKAIQERFAIISDAETIGQLTIKLKNATSFTVLLSAVREAGIEHCGIDIAVLPSKEVKHSIGISPNGNHADKLTPNALRAQLLKHRGVTILGK